MDSPENMLPIWLLRLREDTEYEADETSWSIKLLEREGRTAVWSISTLLGADNHGVPGQACQLFEHYFFKHVRQMTFSMHRQDPEVWQNFKRVLASRVPLRIASCIQLAAKMSSASVPVSPNFVRACLLSKGVDYTVSEIIDSENHVFSTLGFHVPLWTSVEAAQLMAQEVGMPTDMMTGIAVIANITEYCRDRLNHRVKSIANVFPGSAINKAKVRTLHLVAGVVLASARYLWFQGQDPTARLADLTKAPVCYIKCICDAILADVLNDDIGGSSSD